MEANKKNLLFLILFGLMFLLESCVILQKPVFETKPAAPQPMNDSVSKRFQEAAPQEQTAVASAIELSQKYAELSSETIVLQQQNQSLVNENRQLKERIGALEPELAQTKKELAEANDFLIKMQIELNNWKADVIGFRNEIRDADAVQLEVLFKILKTLGGEFEPETPPEQNQTPTITSPNK